MISSYEGRGSLPYRPENDPYTPTYQKPLPFGALKSDGRTVLLAEGGLKETMKAIQDATRASIPQTKELAQRLKAETDEQTFYNIWHFLKTNLKYKLDKNGMEQVRTAARSLADRNKGIDCEDFSIFAYALLINLGYKPKFEIVAFNGKKEFGHIYVIVNGYTIDAVMDLFNKKPKNITKTKHMDIHSLTGVDGYDLGALGARLPNVQIPQFRPPINNAPRRTAQLPRAAQTTQDPQRARWRAEFRRLNAQLKSYPSGPIRSQHWFNGTLGRQIRKLGLLIKSRNLQKRPVLQNLVNNYIFDVTKDGHIKWKDHAPQDVRNNYPTVASLRAQGVISGVDGHDIGAYEVSGVDGYTLAGAEELGEIGVTYIPAPNAIYGIGAVAPPDEITLKYMSEASKLLPKLLQASASNPSALRDGKAARLWRKLRFLIKLNGMPRERELVANMLPFIKDVNVRNWAIMFKPGVTPELMQKYDVLKRLQAQNRAARQTGRRINGLGAAEISAIDQTVDAVDNLLGVDDVSGAQEQIGSFFKKIGKGLKNLANKIKKFQPLRFAAKVGLAPVRGAFLLLLRVNLLKMSSMLKYGYVTDEQVKRLGLSNDAVNKARNTIKKLKQIWYDVGGDPEVLKNTIIKGGGGLSGVEIIEGLGAAPFAAALATAAPIIAKVKVILAAAAPAIKAIAARMKAAKEGQAPPPPQPSTEPLQPQTESVQGLGEVTFSAADDVAAAELLGMLNEIDGLGKFSFKNLLQKASMLIAPKQPHQYPQVFNARPPAQSQQPNFNAQAPAPNARMSAPQGGEASASRSLNLTPAQRQIVQQQQQFAPQPSFTTPSQPTPQQPGFVNKAATALEMFAPPGSTVSTAASALKALTNVNNPPSAAADGFRNPQEQAAANEVMQKGGDGAPGPGDTNVIAPAGGGGTEAKKDNTMILVIGGVAAAGLLYFAMK